MISSNLRGLIERLNPLCRASLEAAAGMCLSRTHHEVDIEHWLIKLLEHDDTDIRRIFRHFGVDSTVLQRDLTRAIDRFKTGNSRNPEISPSVGDLLEAAWTLASIDFGDRRVRTGHLCMALVANHSLKRQIRAASSTLEQISLDALRNGFSSITRGSPEEAGLEPATGAEGSPAALSNAGEGTALERYTIDLTEQARKGTIDPIVGRDREIRQMVDILMRRRQNNPILTGDAGVGKTAVVEGLARQIVSGDVPASLREVTIRTLDLGLLQAGAGVKGEFENRLKAVIQEVKASTRPIILFIDEAHTLVGAGGAAGQGDAANLLKPALARGELRTIAATTWSEYKKYFEKDAALTRRFQVVKVDEPSEEVAIRMLRGVASRLEAHHHVRIRAEAVEEAVHLSHRYLTDRQLPDKAVSVLDTACARVAVTQVALPPALEDCQRRLESLELEWSMLLQEEEIGVEHGLKLEILAHERPVLQARKEALEAQWKEEKRLVERIRSLHSQLQGNPPAETRRTVRAVPTPEDLALLEELRGLEAELAAVQGDTPLMRPQVEASIVAEVISGWTGIPVGRMLRDELTTIRRLNELLGQRVIGQPGALEAIAQRLQTSRAGMDDPNRPVGVFLLAGPSGVGKTETALALAELLYGGERNLITINMSEYQEAHTVSSLKGAPPGYVGYGEGGVLTEAVRRKPYSVVLLDEVEKAHPDVLELFYQVFDKGWMEDGEGREINFKNAVIILTTNLGTERVMSVTENGRKQVEHATLVKVVRKELTEHLAPALLGRLTLLPYHPLADAELQHIVRLKLGHVARRAQQKQVALTWSDEVVMEIASRCSEVDTGARNVDHILSGAVLPEISRELLSRMAEGCTVETVHISLTENRDLDYQLSVKA